MDIKHKSFCVNPAESGLALPHLIHVLGKKKRHLNTEIQELLSSGMSRNNTARRVRVHARTVQRKLEFLGELCKSKNDKLLEQMEPTCEVQFDEMETFVHTKLKPMSIALAVDRESRIILGFELSQIPANGPLAEKSVAKYGFRQDRRKPAMRKMLAGITPLLATAVHFESDKATWYPQALNAVFGSKRGKFSEKKANEQRPKEQKVKEVQAKEERTINYVHTTYKGRKSCITGQGELKKGKYDPLFPLNHTAAMFRYNVSRLIRRTWCTTKKLKNLVYHLNIYSYHHNLKRMNEKAKELGAESLIHP